MVKDFFAQELINFKGTSYQECGDIALVSYCWETKKGFSETHYCGDCAKELGINYSTILEIINDSTEKWQSERINKKPSQRT